MSKYNWISFRLSPWSNNCFFSTCNVANHLILSENSKVFVSAHTLDLTVQLYVVCSTKVANTNFQFILPVLLCPSSLLISITTAFYNLQSHRKHLKKMRSLVFAQIFTSFTHPNGLLLVKVPYSWWFFICTSFRKVLSPETFKFPPSSQNSIFWGSRFIVRIPQGFLYIF